MKLLLKGDEIGYISDYDDQSFGMFCPIATFFDKDLAADLINVASRLEATEKDVVRITAERDKAWTDGCNLLDTVTEQAAQIKALEEYSAAGWATADKEARERAEACERIEALEKDAARYREQEWQPIETAPKDGAHILGWNTEFGARETKMNFYGEGSIGYDAWEKGSGPREIGWDWTEPRNGWGLSWSPTHWMPLRAIDAAMLGDSHV